jgi:hypothetical protein
LVNLISRRSAVEPVRDPLSLEALASVGHRLRAASAYWRSVGGRGAGLPELPEEAELEEVTDIPALEAALLAIDARIATAVTGVRPLPEGRLILCEIEASIGDGLSQAASGGFIDDMDRPPWPTWLVAHARRTAEGGTVPTLLCWIPEPERVAASRAIRANRRGALHWVEARDVGLADQLRDNGFAALVGDSQSRT